MHAISTWRIRVILNLSFERSPDHCEKKARCDFEFTAVSISVIASTRFRATKQRLKKVRRYRRLVNCEAIDRRALNYDCNPIVLLHKSKPRMRVEALPC